MKVKILFFLFLFLVNSVKSEQGSRKLANIETLKKLVDDNNLMQCLFKNCTQNIKSDCESKLILNEDQKFYVQTIKQIIEDIYEKEKNCQAIIDQENFINCRKKIKFQIEEHSNFKDSLKEDIQIIAHVFTGYFNVLKDIENQTKQAGDKFHKFVEDQQNSSNSELNLNIYIPENNESEKLNAQNLVKGIIGEQSDIKNIISKESPKNLHVEVLDHQIEKFTVEQNKNNHKIQIDQNNQSLGTDDAKNDLVNLGQQLNQKLEQLNQLISSKQASDLSLKGDQKEQIKLLKNTYQLPSSLLKEDKELQENLAVIDQKLNSYKQLGNTEEIIQFKFNQVKNQLEELKKEEARLEELKKESDRIKKDINAEIYLKNLHDSEKKVLDLRKQISDHLLYAQNLMQQKQIDSKIIRNLTSYRQLQQSVVKVQTNKHQKERNLKVLEKDFMETNKELKNQIIILQSQLKQNKANKKLNKKEKLFQAIQNQNILLEIQQKNQELAAQKMNFDKQRKLRSEEVENYEKAQGINVLESISKIHKFQNSLETEEKLKSEILHRIQRLIKWKEISLKLIDNNNNSAFTKIINQQNFNAINYNYQFQLNYMLNSLSDVETRIFYKNMKNLKELNNERKYIKAEQNTSGQFDEEKLNIQIEDKQLDKLIEHNLTLEKKISKDSNELQKLRNQFLKKKVIIEQTKKRLLDKLKKDKEKYALLKTQSQNSFTKNSKILFVLTTILLSLFQIIQLQYVLRNNRGKN